jgi:hypothetical protein
LTEPNEIQFDSKLYPIIKLHDDHFEVKAIDYWIFRSFNYSDVLEIEYASVKIWWGLMDIFFSLTRLMFYGKKYCELKITMINGTIWNYKVLGLYNQKYATSVKHLIAKAGLDQE